tara:strand:+ start:285 stop:608 length:324 start_codon:yes stop_codon:yes gene_type:complete
MSSRAPVIGLAVSLAATILTGGAVYGDMAARINSLETRIIVVAQLAQKQAAMAVDQADTRAKLEGLSDAQSIFRQDTRDRTAELRHMLRDQATKVDRMLELLKDRQR